METTETNVLTIHMGDRFNALSPLLQDVHTGKKRIEGTVKVEHGNWLAKIICKAFRFPSADPKTKLSVDCFHAKDQMNWHRDFNGHKMSSSFYVRGEYLVEKLGPLDLYLHAQEDSGGLTYKFSKTTLFGIPVPKFLVPQIFAREHESAGMYIFEVRVRMSLIGLVIAYGGQMQLVGSP